MITLEGYSKDPNIVPEGICVTWSKEMIAECGGTLAFMRLFLETMQDEGSVWYQKCRNKPTQDIIYVYIICGNRVRYRLYYGGHESTPTVGYDGNGAKNIDWGRIVCGGPYVKAPYKIERKGFQGFRYTTKLF